LEVVGSAADLNRVMPFRALTDDARQRFAAMKRIVLCAFIESILEQRLIRDLIEKFA
jgi:hypothetical protein